MRDVSPEASHLRARIALLEQERALLQPVLTGRTARPCTIAIATYAAHFRVLLQFFLSYSVNILDVAACGLLVLVSSASEASSLTSLLNSQQYAAQLAPVQPLLHIVDFPTVLAKLSPGTSTALPPAKNRGTHGRLYVCAKKAYAVRYAHEILDSKHVIVTDSEAYVWKPLSIVRLMAEAAAQPTVWYADAPALTKPPPRRGYAPVDKAWCSLHVYSDARGLSLDSMRSRVPSYGASYFEYMLFYYPRNEFRQYWAAVEATWKKPWFDAVVAAHEAEKRCDAIGFWLEISWHLYLYEHHRQRFTFKNVTAAIEESFGTDFARRGLYVHARLELLWRAVSNRTVSAFRDFYQRQSLPFFRFEHRARGDCLPVRLMADLPAPAASFQANSAVPNWVFTACRSELDRLPRRKSGASTNRTTVLPWVQHNTKTR